MIVKNERKEKAKENSPAARRPGHHARPGAPLSNAGW
jgi:hypothetical protein